MHLCEYICLAHFTVATEQQRDSCHLAEHFYGCNFPRLLGALWKHIHCAMPTSLTLQLPSEKVAVSFTLPQCRCLRIATNNNCKTSKREQAQGQLGSGEVWSRAAEGNEECVSNTNRKSFEVHRSKWPRRQFSSLFVIIIIITVVVVVVGVARAHWKLMSVRVCWFWPTGQASAAATTSASASASSCLWP